MPKNYEMHIGCMLSQGLSGVGKRMRLGREHADKSKFLFKRDQDGRSVNVRNFQASNATY